MQIWEENGKGMLKLSSQDMYVPELGCIAEDRLINSAIYESMSLYKDSMNCIFNSTITNIVVQDAADGTYFTEPVQLTYSTISSNAPHTTDTAVAASSTNQKKSTEVKTVKCR
jgi:hypothetical protein